MNSLHRLSLTLVAVLALAGCNSGSQATDAATRVPSGAKADDDPKAVSLIKHSMDVYAAMPTFTADTNYSMATMGMPGSDSKRTTVFEKPNRFKVVTTNGTSFVQTSVSDGKSLIEYDNMSGMPARTEPAPDNISNAHSMQMVHPMFCGTLLYQFFGGSANYGHLVDTAKGPVTLGPPETINGETAQLVKFYGQQQYGHVETLIGDKTGYVYRIQYDSEPLLKMMQTPESRDVIRKSAESAASVSKDPKVKENLGKALASMPSPTSLTTTEKYSNQASPASIPANTFDITPPKGTTAMKMPTFGAPSAPPVPLGSAAPDFTVQMLDGKSVKLSQFRGHPVLLDFWATWCGPCVGALPHTQEIFSKSRTMGLQVLAISDEDHSTVDAFIKEKGFTFPTALDTSKAAGQAYKTDAIPTTVVIDAGGKLVAYFVGAGQDDAIAEALAKVGIKLPDSSKP